MLGRSTAGATSGALTLDPDIATSGSAAMAKTAFAILKSFLPDCEKVLPGLKLNREAQVRQ
jgi:hypothetical protein